MDRIWDSGSTDETGILYPLPVYAAMHFWAFFIHKEFTRIPCLAYNT